MAKSPHQRDIYWANLDPVTGSEQAGKRPVVVISGDTLNQSLPICIVCPLSTRIKQLQSCTLIQKNQTNKLKDNSEVLTFQVRTISQDRLEKKIGSISAIELQDVIQKVGRLLTY